MATVDFDDDNYINTAGMGPRLLPVQATELLGGIGSQMLRSLLVAAPGDIPEEYACSPEDAAVALACCELAELPAWDEAALIDAATVGGNEEERVMWGHEGRDRLARRIALAMKAEKAPEVMSPADGVLLLRRAGINVFHQLLDAVAWLQLGSDATLPNYRLLKGIAEPQQTAPTQTDTTAPAMAASDAQLIRKNQRPDLLTPLIEKAQRGESDPFNAAVIWPKLCDMAEQKVKPFIGKTGDGLQWIDANDDPKFLPKEALGDRLRRAKKAAIELAKPR